MDTKVFKFGGASMKDAAHIYNVKSILEKYTQNKLLVVVSAMGKTTNALEQVFKDFCEKGKEAFDDKMDFIIEMHLKNAEELGVDVEAIRADLVKLKNTTLKTLLEKESPPKDMIYDQIVALGELFSTKLLSSYLSLTSKKVTWLDVRDVLKTDDNFQEALVDFSLTKSNVDEKVEKLFKNFDVIITQGFLGSTSDNLTTTLGREGSDYTAAIFAYCLEVEELSIWKDVPGILTADPRRFENVQKIDRMSYKEAIEMTYYGAKVIHPKTISPIQNKGIKLNVKSFIDPEGEGTIIGPDGLLNYPPIVVVQDDMILLQIFTKDFSFIAEDHLSIIFSKMKENRIKMRMMKNSAVSFTICISNPGQARLEAFKNDLGENFSFDVLNDLQLITVRYFTEQLIDNLMQNKVVLFEERMKYTIQLAVRPLLELIEKS